VARRLDNDLVELRRDIHSHPELPGQEQRTAGLVAARLRAAGLDVTTGVGGYGVVGVLRGTRPGRTVAYRADMDAVPPGDQVGGGTAVAHLCGHDIHTTVGVGVAEVLATLRGRLAGTVMFVFQPAEESLAGAAAMLAGETNTLGTVLPPATPAELDELVRSVQTPDGPLAEFVYMRAQATETEVRVSYRCWPEERYVAIRAEINRLAQSYGGATVTFPPAPFPAMVSPEREGRAVERYLRHAVGWDGVTRLYAAIPFSGEDFSLFLDEVPGTYTFLGVRSPGAAVETSYPHFGTFDPDERAIGHGVRAMAGWLADRAR
jgi:metal-dependent amidase/aminoacylase/carboxypeptidase family protein